MSQGIDFVKIEDGKIVDTVFLTRSPAIKAFINTSNMGPNAHVGQDFGWRLGPVWFKKLEEARGNATVMLSLGVDDNTSDAVLLMKLWNAEVKTAKRHAQKGSATSGDSYRAIIDNAVEAEPVSVEVEDKSETTEVKVNTSSKKKK